MYLDLTPDGDANQSLADARFITLVPVRPSISVRLGRRVVGLWQQWRQNIRDRRALAYMDARALRDIGLNEGLVEYELRRPFWQTPRDLRF
jgi:uncharacterized protein YjiS (DUF1127 family)